MLAKKVCRTKKIWYNSRQTNLSAEYSSVKQIVSKFIFFGGRGFQPREIVCPFLRKSNISKAVRLLDKKKGCLIRHTVPVLPLSCTKKVTFLDYVQQQLTLWNLLINLFKSQINLYKCTEHVRTDWTQVKLWSK